MLAVATTPQIAKTVQRSYGRMRRYIATARFFAGRKGLRLAIHWLYNDFRSPHDFPLVWRVPRFSDSQIPIQEIHTLTLIFNDLVTLIYYIDSLALYIGVYPIDNERLK